MHEYSVNVSTDIKVQYCTGYNTMWPKLWCSQWIKNSWQLLDLRMKKVNVKVGGYSLVSCTRHDSLDVHTNAS